MNTFIKGSNFSAHARGCGDEGGMNEVCCADYTSEMVFLFIHKGGRNMREFLTPRQLGADWPRAHPAERESSQLPARVTNTFSSHHIFAQLSRKWESKSRFPPEQHLCWRKAGKMSVYQLFPFLSLQSRLLRQLILIHNKPVEI